jgi:hypothetical protein
MDLIKKIIKAMVGEIPENESNFKKKMRIHQGWWRAFVLLEEQGKNPAKENENVCNTFLLNEKNVNNNFLSAKISETVSGELKERKNGKKAGIINKERLMCNLLSSQPLCFNFFAEFKDEKNKLRAKELLKSFFPKITEFEDVLFEYNPVSIVTQDNSAFDVAFKVRENERKGLIGLECKYTDEFSKTEYGKEDERYKDLFNESKFFNNKKYEEYVKSEFNQLFRNQIIAEALIKEGKYDFVYTGLFCHYNDKPAIQTGKEFSKKLNNGGEIFKVITYKDFFEKIQKLNLDWEMRELSMMLWARYCGECLSEEINKQYKG